MTKIVRLAPPAPLFNIDCRIASSFLTSTVWHSFSRLDKTFSQGKGKIFGISDQVKYFLGIFWEDIAGGNRYCQ